MFTLSGTRTMVYCEFVILSPCNCITAGTFGLKLIIVPQTRTSQVGIRSSSPSDVLSRKTESKSTKYSFTDGILFSSP